MEAIKHEEERGKLLAEQLQNPGTACTETTAVDIDLATIKGGEAWLARWEANAEPGNPILVEIRRRVEADKQAVYEKAKAMAASPAVSPASTAPPEAAAATAAECAAASGSKAATSAETNGKVQPQAQEGPLDDCESMEIDAANLMSFIEDNWEESYDWEEQDGEKNAKGETKSKPGAALLHHFVKVASRAPQGIIKKRKKAATTAAAATAAAVVASKIGQA